LAGFRLRLFRRLIPYYAAAPLQVRARLFLRAANCPLDRVASLVPTPGTVLDLGCGCGFATGLLASVEGLTVVGLDHDECALAQAVRAVPAARFIRGTALAIPVRGLDAILVSDVLYLLPGARQVHVLSQCRDALAPGGTLVLKTTDVRPVWKYWWNLLQETIVVKVLRLTRGAGCFSFPGRQGFESMLRSLGFQVEGCVMLGRGYLHPHVALIARRVA
jgi:SAM-dependent methyltransferase